MTIRRRSLPDILPTVLALGLAACSGDVSSPSSTPAPVFSAVSAGGTHACGVAVDGTAYCWGVGTNGQLGQGARQNASLPVRVVGGVSFQAITAGDSHTCALGRDSTAYCWGWNTYYQRGNATDGTEAAPVRVTGNRAYVSIEAGSQHTCALTAAGRIFCWGLNRFGQLGTGDTQTGFQPFQVADTTRFKQVSAGGFHTCALALDGRAFCWGSNAQGQLGVAGDTVSALLPRPVQTTLRFTVVSAGTDHTCGVAVGGAAYCWGANEFGQLGGGDVYRPGLPATTAPRLVGGGYVFRSISAGDGYTCGIDTQGVGMCWGHGVYGQLGDGRTGDQYLPQFVHLEPGHQQAGDLLHFATITNPGATFACGLSQDGGGYCWGTGVLGNGATEFSTLPIRVDVR